MDAVEIKKFGSRLSNEQFNLVVQTVVTSFDEEVSKIVDDKNVNIVTSNFLNYYYAKDVYKFFVLVSVMNLAEDIFQNPVLRDFVLNLTDKVSLLLSFSDFSIETDLINNIVVAVTRNKPPDISYSLINAEVKESLHINPATLKSLLQDNFWLVMMYLIIMFLNKTSVFKILQQKTAGKGNIS